MTDLDKFKSPKELAEHIISLCGGDAVVMAELQKEEKSYTVLHSWKYRGISDRYWPMLIELSNGEVDADMLFHLKTLAREKRSEAS